MNNDAKTCLVDGKYGIRDLVDLAELRRIFERFTEATGFTIGFLDHPGLNILIASGWRDICTKFHRGCPVAAANCTKSNRRLLDNLNEPGKLLIESCENGLVDCAFPIIIKGKHIASLATGQLMLEKPDLGRFKRQARLFGFDESEYLQALDDVPVVSEEKLRSVTTFLGEMALVISELGYAHLITKETTERLKNEMHEHEVMADALRETSEQFQQALMAAHTVAWMLDLASGTLEETGPISEFFGRPSGFRHGNDATFFETIHPDDRVHVRTQVARAIHSNGNDYAVDFRTVWPDGSIRWVMSSGSVERDAAGRPLRIRGICRDITERKQAEAEKERLQGQLIQAQKMESIGRLAGGVAHDFNNMLMAILGNAELCKMKLEPGNPLHQWLDAISKGATHAKDLTSQLLAFARLQPIKPRVLDLNTAISDMLKWLQRLIGEHIAVNWQPGADLWLIEVDSTQINQILTNLITNARDAIQGTGSITLSTANIVLDPSSCAKHSGVVPGNYVVLSIADTGCGMDQETLAHVFEPFFTTKVMGKGTGLGLATVYGIVKQNNGFIDINSQPGRGTKFNIYLPRAQNLNACSAAARVSESAAAGGNETILLVEDQEYVRNVTRDLLATLGYTVLVAESPSKAIRLVAEHAANIHLLVTDVIMPEMNGMQLAQRLSELRPSMKSLFISGFTYDAFTQQDGFEKDVHFLQKPFSCNDLARKVREALTTGCKPDTLSS